MTLSVVIVTLNEEANLARTLESVRWADEIVIVDSGSTDRTVEIAKSFNAKVFTESWKGYAAQKNSAIEKATGEWILALDADEVVERHLALEIASIVRFGTPVVAWPEDEKLSELDRIEGILAAEEHDSGKVVANNAVTYRIPFKHHFLGRWLRWGGQYPDRKIRLFRRGKGRFGERAVHESVLVDGPTAELKHAILHYGYPTLRAYIGTMNRYSTLAAEQIVKDKKQTWFWFDVWFRPVISFKWRYFFRLGFLDGREGFLFHLYHAAYVSWKYAKAWELTRKARNS